MSTPNPPRPRPSTPAGDASLDKTFVSPAAAEPQLDATLVGGTTDAAPVGKPASKSSVASTPAAKSPATSAKPAAAPAKPAAATDTPSPEAPLGPNGKSQLGDFKLIKKLGQGGMGEVFLAHQLSLDRTAALKVLAKHLAEKPDFIKRFLREARAMAKVDHPNAVRVFHVGEDDGVNYVAMEFVDGKSLQYWLDKLGKLPVGDAVHVTLRCAEALEVAHQQNMVHRDIKPDNIMLTARGQVKVADFGLAKAMDEEEMSMTQSGTGLGTPYYMAPEQARNAKHVDGRSDIYALGVTLYHFLTGKLPFSGNSAMDVILAKEQGRFTPARRVNPEVPEKLDLLIDKMIAKDPNQRFKDPSELIRFLGGLGLESPSLSFITAPDKVVATAAARGPASKLPGTSGVAAPTRPAAPRTSAEDAQKAESAALPEGQWLVLFKTKEGKDTMVKWTVPQILQALRSGAIDARAKVKRKASEQFMPIAQFREFEQAVQGLLVKQKADQKASDMKAIYAKLDKQQSWRKTTLWFKGLFSNVMGLVSLVVYLAVIAGVCVGGFYAWKTYGGKVVEQIKTSTTPAPPATTPAAPNPTPASDPSNPAGTPRT